MVQGFRMLFYIVAVVACNHLSNKFLSTESQCVRSFLAHLGLVEVGLPTGPAGYRPVAQTRIGFKVEALLRVRVDDRR